MSAMTSNQILIR